MLDQYAINSLPVSPTFEIHSFWLVGLKSDILKKIISGRLGNSLGSRQSTFFMMSQKRHKTKSLSNILKCT